MTRIALILFLSSITQNCMSQTSQDFHLKLYISVKERSKDSNSTTEQWHINEGKLHYSVSYSGRRGPNQKNKRKEIKINDQQIDTIKKLLEDKNLYQNIPSPKYNEFAAPYVATEVSLTSKKEEESYQIQIYDLSREISKNEIYRNMIELKELLNKYLDED